MKMEKHIRRMQNPGYPLISEIFLNNLAQKKAKIAN
jgi:hypothetical protein